LREIEILFEEDWVDFKFKSLVKGDVFRIFDNGELFVNSQGESEFIVAGDPYLNDDGIWQVDIAEG
jgi:hypothetical protein